MCDPTAMLMAGNSVAGMNSARGAAQVKSMEARSVGDFHAAQMENMSILAEGKALRQQRDLDQQFAQGIINNVAAGVMSGIDPSSFSSIEKGAMKYKRQAYGDIGSNLAVEKSNLKMSGIMAKVGGDMEAAAARLQGTMESQRILMSGMTDLSKGFKGFKDSKGKKRKWNEWFDWGTN